MKSLALADSLLVDVISGVPHTRGFDRHLARFTSGLQEIGYREDPQPFFDDSVQRVIEYAREQGASFPRFECWRAEHSLQLELALRPAPVFTQCIRLVTEVLPERPLAHLKGPLIGEYGELTRAMESEVLILAQDGVAIEGTTTSLVWWEHNTLTRVSADEDLARVASVTETLIGTLAIARGDSFAEAQRTAAELITHEVWAVNALHGIRPVTHIDGVRLPDPQPERLAHYRELYSQLARPLG